MIYCIFHVGPYILLAGDVTTRFKSLISALVVMPCTAGGSYHTNVILSLHVQVYTLVSYTCNNNNDDDSKKMCMCICYIRMCE